MKASIKGRLNTVEKKLEDAGPLLYLILVTVAAVAGGILLFVVVHQQHQIRHEATDIQTERIDSVLRSCEDQNQRHKDAVTALNNLLIKSGVKPANRAKARQPVLSLIDALAPKQDCATVVAAAVPGAVVPPSRPTDPR